MRIQFPKSKQEEVGFEWVFSHIDLQEEVPCKWDFVEMKWEREECDGEFHSRRIFFKDHTIDIHQCDKCGEMRTLEELQVAAAESYVSDWEKFCKREIHREDDNSPHHESNWEQIQSYGQVMI